MRRLRRLVPLVVAASAATAGLVVAASGDAPARRPGEAFLRAAVKGTTTDQVTTLRFGPDGRLYVGEQTGIIRVLTLDRLGRASYEVTDSETVGGLIDIVNHDDDGRENPELIGRLLTGLDVTGTAERPVIYAVSSDPRIGGGPDGTETGVDTNSGVLSRLTWDGSRWQRIDLVRGLPRSKENHTGNGIVVDEARHRVLVAQGAHTNSGAPSRHFMFLPEYALSGAILEIDLDAIGAVPYDLPTLDDPERPGSLDAGDPFGGHGGLNQARVVAGGPVRIYAPGFRNPYDLVLTTSGRLYTVDNGANAGWGDAPEPAGGHCTGEPRPGGARLVDTLHLISHRGYYGGHPNPTRANLENRFGGQSPVEGPSPEQCRFGPTRRPGTLTTFPSSTNGLAEYASGALDGEMDGDLLAASLDGRIYRIELRPDGRLARREVLFEEVGQAPLDVTTQGDDGAFPGTIWVGDVASGAITVFEPAGPEDGD